MQDIIRQDAMRQDTIRRQEEGSVCSMSFQEYTLKEFSDVLASKEAVPGGGGASALVGAVGIALGNMVGSLTVGKKKYLDVEADIQKLMQEAEFLRAELLAGMDADAESFLPLSKAYGIPKDNPDRAAIMEEALVTACKAPLDLMKTLCRAIDVIHGFAEKGSKLAISDAGVGVVCCKAALQGASLNIFINTKSMKDRAYAREIETEAEILLEKYCPLADEIYETVVGRIRQ